MRQVTRIRPIAIAFAGVAGVLLLGAAQQPVALAKTSPGLWEFSGVPGTKAPVRECLADLGTLAQFEHRKATCTRTVLSDKESSMIVEYTCSGGGFGHSEIQIITPRNLRISTQGISDGLPFNYVLQARRVGDCPKSVSASRH
jgi:hypothetical protein